MDPPKKVITVYEPIENYFYTIKEYKYDRENYKLKRYQL